MSTVFTVFPHHIYRPHGKPCNFRHPRSNYRGYCGITAFPVAVSSSVYLRVLNASI